MREPLYDCCLREDRKDLLYEWDCAADLPLAPAAVSRGRKRKVWWKCDKGHPTRNGDRIPSRFFHGSYWWYGPLGHEYQASVGAHTNSGGGCPICGGAPAGNSWIGTVIYKLRLPVKQQNKSLSRG